MTRLYRPLLAAAVFVGLTGVDGIWFFNLLSSADAS